jgi:IS4 transposase
MSTRRSRSRRAQTPLNQVEAFLQDLISQLEPDPDTPPGRGRPRILPSTCLWAGLLVCVLHGFSSQLALWRLLTAQGLWHYPRFAVSDQAVYNRLASGGTADLAWLFAQISTLLTERTNALLPDLGPPLASFATEVVVLDETTLDPVARRLSGQDAASRHLPGTLAAVFDLRRQLWCQVALRTDWRQNEKVLARELLATVPPGSLVLADMGYFAFHWFDDLTDGGYYWISRLRNRTSVEVVHIFTEEGDTFDGLVWLGKYRADRSKHLVRLVCFRHGQHLRQYLTNVRDPAQLPVAEIARLYARRWDIEMAFQLVKEHLGIRLWWSTKDVVIHQQLYAVLILAQIVQALRLEIAVRAGVDLFEVSVPLLVRYLPQFAARGEDPVAVFVERGRAAGFIRPSRRIQIHAPDPPLEHAWSLTDVPILRTPRYAERNCGPRPHRHGPN